MTKTLLGFADVQPEAGRQCSVWDHRLGDVNVVAALIALAIGFGGVLLGARLTRHNDRRSRADDLLARALSDAVAAISDVAAGTVPNAMASYGSAVARIALHAPPQVVQAWRYFQDDATTGTEDGRSRLVTAIQAARKKLGHGRVSDRDLHVLLFGPRGVGPVEFQALLSSVQAEMETTSGAEPRQPPDGTPADDFTGIVDTDPAMAVFQGYIHLERALHELLLSAGSKPDERRATIELARQAADKGLITPETLNAFEGLTVLRNLVAHGRSEEVTEGRARDYLALVDALLFAIRQNKTVP
jgi:hypothetical protein